MKKFREKGDEDLGVMGPPMGGHFFLAAPIFKMPAEEIFRGYECFMVGLGALNFV